MKELNISEQLKDIKLNTRTTYIEFCCPNCGEKMHLDISINSHMEVFEGSYNCNKCKNKFDIEYDIILGKLNINTGMYLKQS